MKMSAGIVVSKLINNERKFLLLRVYSNWDFPKGIVEKDETSIQAALRETEEETGITELHFKWGSSFIDTEPYGKKSRKKFARFFVAETDTEEVVLGRNPKTGKVEHHSYGWYNYSTARMVLHPRLKTVLDWAVKVIDARQ